MAAVVRRFRSAAASAAFSSGRGGAPLYIDRSPTSFVRGRRLLSHSTPQGGRNSGGLRNVLKTKWNNSAAWIRETIFSESSEKYSGTEKVLKLVVGIGGSLYALIVGLDSAAIWYIDRRVDLKINAETDKRLAFQSLATKAHNDHIANTQSDWKKTQDALLDLKDKMMQYQEKELMTRHLLMAAAKFFELNGYLIISADEFKILQDKVADLESKIPAAMGMNDETVKFDGTGGKVLNSAPVPKDAKQGMNDETVKFDGTGGKVLNSAPVPKDAKQGVSDGGTTKFDGTGGKALPQPKGQST